MIIPDGLHELQVEPELKPIQPDDDRLATVRDPRFSSAQVEISPGAHRAARCLALCFSRPAGGQDQAAPDRAHAAALERSEPGP